MKLRNQTAIVTGAGRGIGRAIALAFAREGANLTLAARTSAEIDAVAEEIHSLGREALAVTTDVASKASVQEMVAQTIDRFGHVDTLVNNAGVGGTSPIPKITEELWDLNIAVNLKGVFLCTQAVFTHTCDRGSGHSVNVTSLADRKDGANFGAYAAAKWGARRRPHPQAVAPPDLHDQRLPAVLVNQPVPIPAQLSLHCCLQHSPPARYRADQTMDNLLRPEDVSVICECISLADVRWSALR